ncbi:unnamed protein product [Leptidea sinapis]|uniref:Nicastrin n=1 Tax=Leptidea sinapis TaxID=189913 RepID=A0A5E4QAR5_9NEOP|nr:unnamed protein product [Leptidea sinapis]
MYLIITVTLFILGISEVINGERLHGRIYSSIEGSAACFRRLNATHQVGCSSSDNGTVGVVHMINDISDAQWLVYNSSAGPYIGVVSTNTFNSAKFIQPRNKVSK